MSSIRELAKWGFPVIYLGDDELLEAYSRGKNEGVDGLANLVADRLEKIKTKVNLYGMQELEKLIDELRGQNG